jgi:hypothetical protein
VRNLSALPLQIPLSDNRKFLLGRKAPHPNEPPLPPQSSIKVATFFPSCQARKHGGELKKARGQKKNVKGKFLSRPLPCFFKGLKTDRSDLRHDFGSRIVIRGNWIEAARELLSHADRRMAARDTHLSPGYLRNAIEAIDKNPPYETKRVRSHISTI